MSIRVEGNESEIADQASAFIKGLADFLKVCILYPPTNKRVQAGADALIQAQEPLFAEDGKLPLLLDGDQFKIGKTVVESRSLNIEWLAACFQKTNLAGLYFDRELTFESLFGLAKKFHKGIDVNSTATTFEEFWPEKFDGVRLLEKRFRGAFERFEDAEIEKLAAQILHGLDPSSREAELTTALLESDDKLTTRMHLLRDVIEEEEDRNPDFAMIAKGVHPYRVILNNLPREAFRDLDNGVAVMKQIIDEVIETIKRNSGQGKSESLESLARKIVTRAFRLRHEDRLANATPSVPVVPAEPKEVSEERNVLLSALETLPDNLTAELSSEDLDAPAEKLGILLHQHVRAGSRETRNRLASLALGYLKSPARDVVAVLDQFLHFMCSPRLKPSTQIRIAEFAQALQDSPYASLLTQFKRFSKQGLLDSFPASFGFFIDSIDVSDEVGREKISNMCRAIGIEKIREHSEFLGTRAGILAPDRIRKLLALSSRDILPLAKIILDNNTSTDLRTIVRYLHAQSLKGAESAALRAIPSPDRLPRDYLSDLCNGHMKGSYRPGLAATSESLIHKFIKEPHRSPSQIEQQARAIMTLGEFPTRETKELLRTLTKRSGFLGRNKAPKPIRQAAKIVLRMFSGGR